MRWNEAARMLAGSIAIYVVMAACGSASGPAAFSQGDGGGGSSGGGTGDGSGGILDALTDPVPGASADPNQSGSRLKVNYFAGADGSKLSALSMHDSMLNIDCTFAMATDGTLRCLPASQGVVLGPYADAACTQPLFFQYPGCSVPTYGLVTASSGSCAFRPTMHVYAVSGPYKGTAFYTGTPTACTLSPNTVSSYAPYVPYTLGAEQAPGTFVQATEQTE